MDIIKTLEQEEIARLSEGKTYPEFRAGDTVSVVVNVIEGTHKRTQAYEGIVICKRNRGLNTSFVVRKISNGEGVERTFQMYSPMIASIEVKRRVLAPVRRRVFANCLLRKRRLKRNHVHSEHKRGDFRFGVPFFSMRK